MSILDKALRAAALLRAAYKTPGLFDAWFAPRAAECGVIDNGDVTELVFRGSESCTDWLRDLDVRKIFYYPMQGEVHRGFLIHASHVLLPLLAHLDSSYYDTRPIKIYAHSLGAGILPIITSTLLEHDYKVAEIWGFGMPRMCDEKASKTFDADCDARGIENHRVVAVRRGRQDLVTRVPLSKHGWWHVMKPLIVEDGSVYTTPADWESVRFDKKVGRIANWRILSRLRAATGAHGISWYLRAIEEAQANEDDLRREAA